MNEANPRGPRGSATQSIIALLKRLPIDLGQGAMAETTKGKQIALSLVSDGRGRRALDVGARHGEQSRWLTRRGWEVTAIDIEPRFEACLEIDANRALPFDDEYFDLVWCSEVIEHLADPGRSLLELRHVTRPGGELILTTPNSYAWLFRFIALFGLTPERIQRDDHLHFFARRDIDALAPGSQVYGYFPYMIVKCTIRRGVGALSPTFVIHIRKPPTRRATQQGPGYSER